MTRGRERYGAYFQIVVGALITGLCGLCTLSVVTSHDEYGFSMLGWFFGGIPTLVGVFILARGLQKLG
jgi:hypothetical protein